MLNVRTCIKNTQPKNINNVDDDTKEVVNCE